MAIPEEIIERWQREYVAWRRKTPRKILKMHKAASKDINAWIKEFKLDELAALKRESSN